MRRLAAAAAWAAVCALVATGSRPASADILVSISKSSQRMSVLVDGTARHTWKVSTGAKRYTTPNGVYQPQWLARKWRSKKYGNAPMPHSIFFHNGYAIHGTTEISRLGRIASHGCVRLHPDNAATLYSLVQNQMAHTRVVVSDDAIDMPGDAPNKKPNQFVAEKAAAAEPVAEPEIAHQTIADQTVADQTIALAPGTVAAPQEPQAAEPAATRETVRPPRPARLENVARAHSPGFRW